MRSPAPESTWAWVCCCSEEKRFINSSSKLQSVPLDCNLKHLWSIQLISSGIKACALMLNPYVNWKPSTACDKLKKKKMSIFTKSVWWETLRIWSVGFLSCHELNVASDRSFLKLLVNTNNLKMDCHRGRRFYLGVRCCLISWSLQNQELLKCPEINWSRQKTNGTSVIKRQNIFGV